MLHKKLLTLTVAALLSGAHGQDLKKPVSLTLKVVPLERALGEITKASGVQMAPGAAIKNELILISVQNVPVEDLMAKIAKTLQAEWSVDGQIHRLSRSPAMEKQRESAELALRVADIEKQLSEKRGLLAKMGAFDNAAAESLARKALTYIKRSASDDRGWYLEARKTEESSPAGRLFNRVLAQFPAAELAKHAIGTRTVYSTAPTRMQRPMPVDIAGALAEFAREQELYYQVASPLFKREDEEENPARYYNLTMTQPNKAVAPFKALLTVTSEANDAGGMSSDLIVADSRGRIVARSNMRFKTSFDALNEQMNAAPPSDKGTPVELPARTKRLMEMVKKMMGSSPQAIEDPEIRTALLNPATHDPLELVVGDSAVAAASALGQNLVLQPHDVLFMTMLFQLVMGQPVAETFFDRLATIGDMHLEREEGWLLARPNRPIWANEQLLDRKAAADLFESYKRENRMSLDALAKFSLAQGREPILLMFLAMFIFPESGDQLYGSWDVLKYFGSLSAEQRTAAEKHATYKFSQLSPAQITLLAGMVFKSRPNMTYTHDEAGGNPYELLSSEVTEAFPNGVPPDGELELSMQNEPVVFASASSPGAYNPSPRPMTTHELAWEAFTKERQDLFPWGAESPTYDRFQEGKSQLWTFEFKLNKHLAVHKQLRDNTYDPRSPKLKLDQLPEKFRSEVTAKIEELRKSHANSKPGDFGGARKTNKPPLR